MLKKKFSKKIYVRKTLWGLEFIFLQFSTNCDNVPSEFKGFGAMDGDVPYEFIVFGTMDANCPYEVIGFGAMDGKLCV